MNIRQIKFSERGELVKLIGEISLFNEDERSVILELMDDTQRTSDYTFWGIWEDTNEYSSFICYGPTPMTEGTYDMYWIGTSDKYQNKGKARILVDKMKSNLREVGARLIRIETSGQDSYDSTRAFYFKLGLIEAARIKDFYKPNDDLIIYAFYF